MEVVVESSAGVVPPVAMVGGELRPCDPPEDLGGGFCSFREPVSGREWVAEIDLGRPRPGKYAARYVRAGATAHQVAMEMAAKRPVKLPAPLYGKMAAPWGEAYYPPEFHRTDPGETMRLLREDWEKRGREKWAFHGWPIEKERVAKDSMQEQMKIARRIALRLGPEWGVIMAAWVLRGRKFPHPWGAGMAAWIGERLKQQQERAVEAEGFEV